MVHSITSHNMYCDNGIVRQQISVIRKGRVKKLRIFERLDRRREKYHILSQNFVVSETFIMLK